MDYYIRLNGEIRVYPNQMRELQTDFEQLLFILEECSMCVSAARRRLRIGKEPLFTMGMKLHFKNGTIWSVQIGEFRDTQHYLLESQLRTALLANDARSHSAAWEMFDPEMARQMGL